MALRISLRDLEKKLKNIEDGFTKSKLGKDAGEFVAERIRRRTRLGRGLEGPLKPLSPSYKEFRRGNLAFFTTEAGVVVPVKNPRRKPKLSPNTSPGKSNLTFTGQMLDAIRVISVSIGKVTVGFAPGRSGKLTNKKVAEYVSKERPFFGLTKAEEAGLQKFISDALRKIVRKS